MQPFAPVSGYPGNEEFARILTAVACPTPLPRVRTLLLGALSATTLPPFDAIFTELWGGEPPRFKDQAEMQQFVGGVLGLWNRLAVGEEAGRFRLSPGEPVRSAAAVVQRVTLRQDEMQGFFRGLDVGGTDPDAMWPEGREAIKHLAEASAFLEAYEQAAAAGPAPDAKVLKETEQTLLTMEQKIEELIGVVVGAQKAQRAATVEGSLRTAPAGVGSVLGRAVRRAARVGRNDACPCGSGRKYKHCCGR